ncbi:IS66 family transposase [Phyllobacterium phragmitis]|uniref:IS66 family transposase n=1 Tax=Phyllobacterium phragmitis TaxID=2670329 RepID=A0A2S9IJS1_9HYPH|nr:IS66 family transposase [Phyllobacterium phragmitis]PRD40758.1 IS66 family transposase [Phyllobacterium phragmitis]
MNPTCSTSDPDELLARIAALKAENGKLVQKVAELEEALVLANLKLYGPSSEKLDDRVFNEAEQAAGTENAEEYGDDGGDDAVIDLPDTGLAEPKEQPRKKRGRKRLPAHLPRERVEYDLRADQKLCPCCRHPLHRMGEVVTEQLHVVVSAKVLQNARAKYACRNCERTGITTPVVIAPMPAQPLPGSVATPSTLALTLVGKYVDGTPLYRLSQAFDRINVPMSRGALGNWVIRACDLHLNRIYDALKEKLLAQPVIHGDETWVQVLKEKGRKAQNKSYMWAFRSAQDSEQPIVLFEYQPGRGQQYPQAFLGDYRGLLISDGYEAWRTIRGATHFGCMAHARRKFNDALKAMKKPGGAPMEAMKVFAALYQIEKQAQEDEPGDGETRHAYTLRLRQQHSVPVLNSFREWLETLSGKIAPKSKLGRAISYTLNQWDYLVRYTSDGRVPIDNNVLERDIRPFCTGRKSWLFSDTVDGAKASAVVYSLVLTCRACGVDPFKWLSHVLTELPRRNRDDPDIDDLLPFNFAGREEITNAA